MDGHGCVIGKRFGKRRSKDSQAVSNGEFMKACKQPLSLSMELPERDEKLTNVVPSPLRDLE